MLRLPLLLRQLLNIEPRMPRDGIYERALAGRCHACGGPVPSQGCSPHCPFTAINAQLARDRRFSA